MGTLTCDRKPYLEKAEDLKVSIDSVYNCHIGSCIVALSRRGPRLLEKIFEDEYRRVLNTVTEFALPFLYHQLSVLKNQDENVVLPQIHIMDDAIYYGSTIEGLWKEMALYEQLYKLEGKVQHHVHVCIKSKHSKPLTELNLPDSITVENGFEHYFVKNLTAELRTLHKFLEVEYPIISYHIPEKINRDVLIKCILDTYGESSSYRIDFPDYTKGKAENGKTGIDETISCVNVVLDGGNAIFEKMRIKMTDHEVYICCMAPRNLHLSYRALSYMYLNTEVGSIWKWAVLIASSIVDKLSSMQDITDAYNGLAHNVEKSLVALANYFYSFNTIVEQKETLEGIFASLGYDATFRSVEEQDVFYLIGNKEKAKQVRDIFNDLYKAGKTLEPRIQNVGDMKIDYQVFEKDFPDGLIKRIGLQDRMLLEKCNNLSEALSALFYNQTLLLEHGTRGVGKKNDNTRLRFGQTFDALFKLVPSNDVKKRMTIYKWIDRNIDLGCIVPQYVYDPKSNYWTRVFRPGENEDIVLGQLSRLAVFCFRCIDEVVGAGWIPKDVFSDLLSVIFLKSKFDLNWELGLNLTVSGRELLFQIEDAAPTGVLSYLGQMSVLDCGDFDVRIGSSIEEYNIGEFTSMGKQVDEHISSLIKQILKKADQAGLPPFDTSYYTNLFFIDRMSRSSLNNELEMAFDHVEEVIEKQLNTEKDLQFSTPDIDSRLIDDYYCLDDFLVIPAFWTEFAVRDDFTRFQFEEMERHIINFELLVDSLSDLVYKKDNDAYESFVEYYNDPIWGENVVNPYFLNSMSRIYKDCTLTEIEKERMILEESYKFLQILRK